MNQEEKDCMQGSHAFWKIFFLRVKKEKRKPKHCFAFPNLGLTLDLTLLWLQLIELQKMKYIKIQGKRRHLHTGPNKMDTILWLSVLCQLIY